MKFRKLGKLNIELSALGFGAMRLPIVDGNIEKIDEKYAIDIMRYGFDKGINIVDTAYPYHGGNGELVVGKALKNGYRDKVYLSTKSPTWALETEKDFDKYLDEQLIKLDVEYIDFYHLHFIFQSVWDKINPLKVIESGIRAKEAGKIKYFGFSTHDSYEFYKNMLSEYDWDFTLVQHNYLHENTQVTKEGVKLACLNDIPLLIMEPLMGGALANPPKKIKEIWEANNLDPVNSAFQWLWNKPEVSCILSGMSTLDQLKANLKFAEMSSAGCLDNNTKNVIEKVVKTYSELEIIPCTKCKYCSNCPKNINISDIISLYNDQKLHGGPFHIQYKNHIKDSHKGNVCIKCKKCEEKCPQNIKISELIPKIHDEFMEMGL